MSEVTIRTPKMKLLTLDISKVTFDNNGYREENRGDLTITFNMTFVYLDDVVGKKDEYVDKTLETGESGIYVHQIQKTINKYRASTKEVFGYNQ
jgi:hypothetical protein